MTIPEQDDHEFEAYLRRFRPLKPRPFPGKGPVLFRRWAFPAAAAACAAAVFALAIPRLLHPPSSSEAMLTRGQQVSLVRLSLLANRDPDKLDSQLDRVSPTLLPDVQSGHGVLKTLSAKERF